MIDSPTRQLADEHEFVLLVVGAMEAEAASIERTGRVHTERVIQMVDFTRNFTDGDHHTKEEDLLFPLLEERSASAGGTISVLLSEHEAARDCIRAIDTALPDADGADPERAAAARAVIAENLKLYAFLLPLHIGKEDTVLFPLTERGAQRPRAGDARRGVPAPRSVARRRGDRRSATTAWPTTSRRRRPGSRRRQKREILHGRAAAGCRRARDPLRRRAARAPGRAGRRRPCRAGALRRAAARRAGRPRARHRPARRSRLAGHHGLGRPPVLRLRHRRFASRGRGGRLAGHGVGPERRRLHRLARGRDARAGGAALAGRAVRPAVHDGRRLRDRGNGGQPDGACRGASRRAGACRVGCRRAGTHRGACRDRDRR